jgi:hypothetical protein
MAKFVFTISQNSPGFSLIGAVSNYANPPARGNDVDTHLLVADASDYVVTFGSIREVENWIRITYSPGVTLDARHLSSEDPPLEPGDKVRPYDIVVHNKGNRSAPFWGTELTIPLAAPTVIYDPVLPATLLQETTSFVVDFGSAGPAGVSASLGNYSPVLTPTLTIGGVDATGSLSPVAGQPSKFVWNGSALAADTVIQARARWTNATGFVDSALVSLTVSTQLNLSRNDLTYEAQFTGASGSVTGDFVAPAPYSDYNSGDIGFTAELLGAGPVALFPPVITRSGNIWSVTQHPLWAAGSGFSETGQWYANDLPQSGQTDPASFDGSALADNAPVKWRVTATDANGTRQIDSNVITKPATLVPVAMTFVGKGQSGATNGSPINTTMTLVGAGDYYMIGCFGVTNMAGFPAATLNGIAGEVIPAADNPWNDATWVRAFKFTGDFPASSVPLVFAQSAGSHWRGAAWGLIRVPVGTTLLAAVKNGSESAVDLSLNIQTALQGALFAGAVVMNQNVSGTMDWIGATKQGVDALSYGNKLNSFAMASGLAAANPRTLTMDHTNTLARRAGAALSFSN